MKINIYKKCINKSNNDFRNKVLYFQNSKLLKKYS